MAKTAALLSGAGATLAVAAIAYRISRHTGVTRAETERSRPGDEIIANPTTVWNRGLTIDATPTEIWPWLAQMGYGRAGFYVPEWVDGVVWGIPPTNRYVLLPQFTHISVGDVLADGPDYIAYWRVKIVEHAHSLVLWTRRHPWHGAPVDPSKPGDLDRREAELLTKGVYLECSWGFYLDPVDRGRTRLLIRTRGLTSPSWFRFMPYGLIDAFLSFALLRKIKGVTEAPKPASPSSGRQEGPTLQSGAGGSAL